MKLMVLQKVGFLEKHVTLAGKVVCVETSIGSSPPLLLVDHHPVVGWQLRQSAKKCLPVHISSVDILNNGVSWLQHVVVGTNIRFTPLRVNPESLSCIINSDTKFGNVGVDLVSLGFASVSSLDFQLEKDPVYMQYYKQLLAAENQAEKRGMGMWADNSDGWVAHQWRRLWDRLSFALLWRKMQQKSVGRQVVKMVKG
ncbi:uncharacterized protein LOC111866017 isoform X3 [Cryptotermes secundus]|uniref:uncharacterized protein LOC111866017 isoform X3 n=1 Tax=Cryptotermes secundus TaxID=105785 RepID=UPI000CD7BDF6|nr:uncharacterized protein LOC111866017 isoform X3 [Cryptotermes secundus]